MFLISRKLAKKRTGLINSNTKFQSAQKFKHKNLRRTKCFNSQNNEGPGTAETPPGCVDRNTRSQADRGPFPSAAMIVEAYGKLSSGGEGRLTSRHQQASDDTTKCSLERQKIFSYKLVLSDINKFAECKAERAGCR